MSKIIKHAESGRKLSHIVKTDNGSYYYIDSNNTYDAGYETMAFIYDEKADNVGSWGEVYVKHYTTSQEMIEGHRYACEHLEELL